MLFIDFFLFCNTKNLIYQDADCLNTFSHIRNAFVLKSYIKF